MTDSDTTALVLDTAVRLFRDKADLQTILQAKDRQWETTLWQAIEDHGFAQSAAPEELGGAGLGLKASLNLLRAAGNVALSQPLTETILANWLLGQAGLAAATGKLAFGPTGRRDRLDLSVSGQLSGKIARLPFALDCTSLVALAHQGAQLVVVQVDLALAQITPIDALAYDPLDMVEFRQVPVFAHAPAPVHFTTETTLMLGAAARAMEIAGALEEMLALTTAYVQERPAFGKVLSKFQVVQQSVAQFAGEVSVALSTAASAIDALDAFSAEGRCFDDPELLLEVTAAKLRATEAARNGARIAHQMHGAIGVTDEHVLHRLSLRALAWSAEYGANEDWAERLGKSISHLGGNGLWALLSTR